MFNFLNDYSEGAHPRILDALVKTNLELTDVYGNDVYSLSAADKIRSLTGNLLGTVVFVSGGTHANLVALSHVLKPYQAIIAADCGHIFVNECGAIEATGHKIAAAKSQNGKLTPQNLADALSQFNHPPHVTEPALVYISQTTEVGTVYSKNELQTLYSFCHEHNLLLYIDGARLGNALAAQNGALSLADISDFSDVFSIGGTKNGMLFGEALVFKNTDLAHNIKLTLKQRGALLSKSRIIGIQFNEMFRDNLYTETSAHANQMALLLAVGLRNLEIYSEYDSTTNIQYVNMPSKLAAALSDRYLFAAQGAPAGDLTSVRLVTSWATLEANVHEFLEICRSELAK